MVKTVLDDQDRLRRHIHHRAGDPDNVLGSNRTVEYDDQDRLTSWERIDRLTVGDRIVHESGTYVFADGRATPTSGVVVDDGRHLEVVYEYGEAGRMRRSTADVVFDDGSAPERWLVALAHTDEVDVSSWSPHTDFAALLPELADADDMDRVEVAVLGPGGRTDGVVQLARVPAGGGYGAHAKDLTLRTDDARRPSLPVQQVSWLHGLDDEGAVDPSLEPRYLETVDWTWDCP